MKRKRIRYSKHPDDEKIWISMNIRCHKRTVCAVVNFHNYTFQILEVSTGESLYADNNPGISYEALLRRVKRQLKKMGAKFGDKEETRNKSGNAAENQRESSRTIQDGTDQSDS